MSKTNVATKPLDETSELKKNTAIFWKKIYKDSFIKPYFYSDDDMALFSTTIRQVTEGHLTASNWKNLYTLIPPIMIEPSATPTRMADTLGLFTMTASQFLARATMDNVTSCHSLSPEDYSNWFAGNLNYLSNPHWSCIAVYLDADSEMRWGKYTDAPCASQFKCPNLVATFNICLGVVGNKPVFMFSRTYGNTSYGIAAKLKFARYVKYKYGIDCCMHSEWASTASAELEDKTFVTVPCTPLILLNNVYLPERYGDIEAVCVTEDRRMYESQPVKMLKLSSLFNKVEQDWHVYNQRLPLLTLVDSSCLPPEGTYPRWYEEAVAEYCGLRENEDEYNDDDEDDW